MEPAMNVAATNEDTFKTVFMEAHEYGRDGKEAMPKHKEDRKTGIFLDLVPQPP